MLAFATIVAVLFGSSSADGSPDSPKVLRKACPEYTAYASVPQSVLFPLDGIA